MKIFNIFVKISFFWLVEITTLSGVVFLCQKETRTWRVIYYYVRNLVFPFKKLPTPS